MTNKIVKKATTSVASGGTTSIAALLRGAVKTKLFEQLCLLVLDGSGSMSWCLDENVTKAQATKSATTQLIKMLSDSTKSAGFYLSIVTYADFAKVQLHTQQINNVNIDDIDLGDEFGFGKATRFDVALAEAEKIASAFLNSATPGSQLKRNVRVLLMSDGYCNKPDLTLEVAETLKSKYGDTVRFCTCLLSKDEEQSLNRAEALMQQIATTVKGDKLCYTRATTGHELRQFFERSSTED